MTNSHGLDVSCLFGEFPLRLNTLSVARAGLEPARALGPADFLATLAFKQAIYVRRCSLDYFITMQFIV